MEGWRVERSSGGCPTLVQLLCRRSEGVGSEGVGECGADVEDIVCLWATYIRWIKKLFFHCCQEKLSTTFTDNIYGLSVYEILAPLKESSKMSGIPSTSVF